MSTSVLAVLFVFVAAVSFTSANDITFKGTVKCDHKLVDGATIQMYDCVAANDDVPAAVTKYGYFEQTNHGYCSAEAMAHPCKFVVTAPATCTCVGEKTFIIPAPRNCWYSSSYSKYSTLYSLATSLIPSMYDYCNVHVYYPLSFDLSGPAPESEYRKEYEEEEKKPKERKDEEYKKKYEEEESKYVEYKQSEECKKFEKYQGSEKYIKKSEEYKRKSEEYKKKDEEEYKKKCEEYKKEYEKEYKNSSKEYKKKSEEYTKKSGEYKKGDNHHDRRMMSST